MSPCNPASPRDHREILAIGAAWVEDRFDRLLPKSLASAAPRLSAGIIERVGKFIAFDDLKTRDRQPPDSESWATGLGVRRHLQRQAVQS